VGDQLYGVLSMSRRAGRYRCAESAVGEDSAVIHRRAVVKGSNRTRQSLVDSSLVYSIWIR